MHAILGKIPSHKPVLIAGPTASGKSSLALGIAAAQGGTIVNADASQVYDCWRLITARPSAEDEAQAPHALYGHLPYDAPYSTGHWLREVEEVLQSGVRPIIVGGTGLNFAALTEGLVDLPETPAEIRQTADAIPLQDLIAELDTVPQARLDLSTRARVQRAWEVQRATGKSLTTWQEATAPPLLPLDACAALVIDAPKDGLTPKIEKRFRQMVDLGAMDEIEAMRDRYDPALPSCKAIGIPQLMAYATGQTDLETAIEKSVIATRQYAKRQRTWFRSKRMDAWARVDVADLSSD